MTAFSGRGDASTVKCDLTDRHTQTLNTVTLAAHARRELKLYSIRQGVGQDYGGAIIADYATTSRWHFPYITTKLVVLQPSKLIQLLTHIVAFQYIQGAYPGVSGVSGDPPERHGLARTWLARTMRTLIRSAR